MRNNLARQVGAAVLVLGILLGLAPAQAEAAPEDRSALVQTVQYYGPGYYGPRRLYAPPPYYGPRYYAPPPRYYRPGYYAPRYYAPRYYGPRYYRRY